MVERKIMNPEEYKAREVLMDGSTILFRPITGDDCDSWYEFYSGLSYRTKYLRLHYIPADMQKDDALRYCKVDYKNSYAFVAEAIEDGKDRIVAFGRYNRLPSGSTAEIAFVIDDNYQERGIGNKLIEWLATVARQNDIDTFEAYVMQENTGMLAVFANYGFSQKREIKDNIVHITFSISKTPEVELKKDERAKEATITSLSNIVKPKSIAVIGASNRPGSIGNLVFRSIIQNGFTGVVYPVSPTSDAVMSVKAYKTILDIENPIDLAMIVVPSSHVLGVVDQCGRKRVKGIVVISDGFKETGHEGAAMEKALRETAFGYGMRIIGPNCMGFINTDPEISLSATFSLTSPKRGHIAFISQSGALCEGVLQYAKKQETGFSCFMSVGNRADIAPTDMVQYWENDEATRVILLYLESFDNPDKFSRISKRVAMKKPILALKGGATDAGSRAAQSHTGAMATPHVVSEALFRQAGIIRVDSIQDMFQSAILLSSQPVPKGNRVAIITNGGGPGTLAADAASNSKLVVPAFSDELVNKLNEKVIRDIKISNPLDLTAGSPDTEFEACLRILLDSPENDSIIVIYIPPAGEGVSHIEAVIERVASDAKKAGKPIMACFVGQMDLKGNNVNEDLFVPYFPFPEDAVKALSNAVRYGDMLRTSHGNIPEFNDIDSKAGKNIVKSVLTGASKRPMWVPNDEMNALLANYGIKTVETAEAKTAEETAEAAEKIGFPVVVKLVSSTITHKSDVGGVILDVNSTKEAADAFNTIKKNLADKGLADEMEGVIIQKMITNGMEIIAGVNEDRYLGHVIMFGLGGTYAELIKDTATRLHPLKDNEAKEMIQSVRMVELLKGYRGAPPMDIKSLEDLLLRISAMVEDIPQIAEMDLNPVTVLPDGQGYVVVDSRIMLK